MATAKRNDPRREIQYQNLGLTRRSPRQTPANSIPPPPMRTCAACGHTAPTAELVNRVARDMAILAVMQPRRAPRSPARSGKSALTTATGQIAQSNAYLDRRNQGRVGDGETMNRFCSGQLVHQRPRTCTTDTRNTIERISTMNDYPYGWMMDFRYPETEITAEPPILATQPQAGAAEWQTMDTAAWVSAASITTSRRAVCPIRSSDSSRCSTHDTDTVCRRCGASAHFDGNVHHARRIEYLRRLRITNPTRPAVQAGQQRSTATKLKDADLTPARLPPLPASATQAPRSSTSRLQRRGAERSPATP